MYISTIGSILGAPHQRVSTQHDQPCVVTEQKSTGIDKLDISYWYLMFLTFIIHHCLPDMYWQQACPSYTTEPPAFDNDIGCKRHSLCEEKARKSCLCF